MLILAFILGLFGEKYGRLFFLRVVPPPAGRDGRLSNLADQVGPVQEGFKISRVGSDRDGSGFFSNLTGRGPSRVGSCQEVWPLFLVIRC